CFRLCGGSDWRGGCGRSHRDRGFLAWPLTLVGGNISHCPIKRGVLAEIRAGDHTCDDPLNGRPGGPVCTVLCAHSSSLNGFLQEMTSTGGKERLSGTFPIVEREASDQSR